MDAYHSLCCALCVYTLQNEKHTLQLIFYPVLSYYFKI